MSPFIPLPLIQEKINSAVGWMAADDDFLAEVHLTTPGNRVQMNFGDVEGHGGVVRLKALEKAIATAKGHIKDIRLKQRFLFKLDHSGRNNRKLAAELNEVLDWADEKGLIVGGMMFNQLLSRDIAEGFVWLGFPDAKLAVQFLQSGYEWNAI